MLDSDGSLWVSRHGQPLHILRTHSGLYLSSGELPGSHLVPEHYTLQLGGQSSDWLDESNAVCCVSVRPLGGTGSRTVGLDNLLNETSDYAATLHVYLNENEAVSDTCPISDSGGREVLFHQ